MLCILQDDCDDLMMFAGNYPFPALFSFSLYTITVTYASHALEHWNACEVPPQTNGLYNTVPSAVGCELHERSQVGYCIPNTWPGA